MAAHWIYRTGEVIKFSNYFMTHVITQLYMKKKKSVAGFVIMKKFYINNW